MWYACVRRDTRAAFWWGNLDERDFLVDLDVVGIVALKCVLKT
jgi:hypothetical protein